VSRYVLLAVALCLLVVGCAAEPTETPDLVGTQVVVQREAAATLTAEAPTATSAPTVTPPPPGTPTAELTDMQIPAPTPTPTSAPTNTPTETPVPLQPTATATPFRERPDLYTVVDVEVGDLLNVRAGPDVTQPIVGTIPPNGMGIHVGEEGQEVDGSLWVPVRYQDTAGWVNSSHLARQAGTVDEQIAARAVQIIMALKNEDLGGLARWAHPDKGIRFSPYAYVRAEPGAPGGQDLVFDASHVREFFADPEIYTWGSFDGTGEPIEFTFREYYERFIYDADFARPHKVGLDETIGVGNTINNIADVYPQAVVVEYHFEGFDPQYAGMDWRSLRLVLEEQEGAWYLVGIVHDEWTI
jgi:hypothetical protein